ncbi:hypothetical protein C8J56DRAFT_1164501 [Mycena floridula]|nr:hypothetical protein C8J56DRAFT_1164501 [Mycena floridula]
MRFLMQMDTIDPRLYSISMVKVESLLLPVHVCTSEKLSAWAEMDDDSDESSFHRLQQLASIYCLIHQARSKRDTFSRLLPVTSVKSISFHLPAYSSVWGTRTWLDLCHDRLALWQGIREAESGAIRSADILGCIQNTKNI